MLDMETRQRYLKLLGYYSGNIDGIEGQLTRNAYKALQDRYFSRAADRDGIYGNDTEKLLLNAYNVATTCRNFTLSEFKCQCGGKYCTGYPVVLDKQLLANIQKIRDKYGVTVITSGLRCNRHNAAVMGSSTSRHTSGKAVDFINDTTESESGRKTVVAYCRTLPKHRYTYCNIGGDYPNMGDAVHTDVE